MDDVVSLTLLRHGVTKANQEKRYLGWTDVSLAQDSLPELIIPCHGFDAIYSSDLKRCIETVRLLYPNEPINIDPRLREIHFGRFEAKTYEELKNDLCYQQWINDPFQAKIPEGELFQQFQERVFLAWSEKLRLFENKQYQSLLFVSHGGPLRLLLTQLSPRSVKKQWWDWKVDFFSGYSLFWKRKDLLKGGNSCISFSVEPFTVKKDG